jgi:hypothetical protein
MTFAGENTWKVSIWWLVVHNLTFETYQAKALAKGIRKRSDNGKCCVEPMFRSLIAALNEILDIAFLVNDGQNVAGKLAILQIGDEWMYNKIIPRLFAIPLQGITENSMKAGTGS